MSNIFQKIKLLAIKCWNWIKIVGGRLYVNTDKSSTNPTNTSIVTRLESHKTKIKLRKPKVKKKTASKSKK